MAEKKPNVELKITSAVMIGGKMVVPGKGKKSEVNVEHHVAIDLVRRGKAEPLTADNAAGGDDAAEKAAAEEAAKKAAAEEAEKKAAEDKITKAQGAKA